MSRLRTSLIHAAIGAAIGISIVSVLVVLTIERRFVISAIAVLGVGGIIGGACFSLVLAARKGKMGIAVGGVIGGISGCVLAMLCMLAYAPLPWPSPQPYPDIITQNETGAGSWGIFRIQTYTVTLPVTVLQDYYEGQMKQYCIGSWQFDNVADSRYSLIRESSCKIRRLWLEQYFRVRLYAITETQTQVTHVDSWQD